MTVLHLYSGNLYGGVESYLVALANDRTVAPHFGLCFGGRLRDELTAAGVPVHDFGAVRFRRPWTVLFARRRLKRLLREVRFDAVVTHSCWPHAVFAPVVKSAGVRLVNMVHDALGGTHWIERAAGRTAPDIVIANSYFTAGLAAKVFKRSPVEVCYPPVAARPPVVNREATRAALGTPESAVVVLIVSRFEPLKGHRVLFDALRQLAADPRWVCWVAGGVQRPHEQELRDELADRAQTGGFADRVRFLGQRSDVPDLMAAADVYCQPNTGPEGFGLTFIEAMLARLPVVASTAGGPLETVAAACGFLTPPGDAGAVAEALALLIGDAEMRAAMAAAGPTRAAELCDPARQMTRLAELILGTSGRARDG